MALLVIGISGLLLHLYDSPSKTATVHLSDLQLLPVSTSSNNNATGINVDSAFQNTTDTQNNPPEDQQSTSDNNVSTTVSVSSNNALDPATTEISVNGQPASLPPKDITEHSSVVSSPNQSTSFTVSSESNNNGTNRGFNSSDEDLSVNSTSISRNQEGD